MLQETYTTEQVLEKLTEEYGNEQGGEPGVEAQVYETEYCIMSSSSESESDQDLDDPPSCIRKRNCTTISQRLVRCLSSALNPDNYDTMPPVKTIKQYTGFLEKPSSTAKTISWINVK